MLAGLTAALPLLAGLTAALPLLAGHTAALAIRPRWPCSPDGHAGLTAMLAMLA